MTIDYWKYTPTIPHPGCYWTYSAWDPIYKNITILLVTLTGRGMLPNITTMYSWICTKYSMKLQQSAKQTSAGYIPALAGCQGFFFFNIVFLKLSPKSKGWWLDINKDTHRTCTLDRKIMRLFNVNKHFPSWVCPPNGPLRERTKLLFCSIHSATSSWTLAV